MKRLLILLVLVGALVVIPAATEGTNANGLFAFVVSTNRGPIPPCNGADCTAANFVSNFVYVANANQLNNFTGFTTRATLHNAFVVNSVDSHVFVNGVEIPGPFTMTPPPTANLLSWSGRWPSTVTCQGQPGSFHTPCDVVGNPAVVPGENAAVVFATWAHAVGEANGTYVFSFTVHGTLNGTPVDLTANSRPIVMTG